MSVQVKPSDDRVVPAITELAINRGLELVINQRQEEADDGLDVKEEHQLDGLEQVSLQTRGQGGLGIAARWVWRWGGG